MMGAPAPFLMPERWPRLIPLREPPMADPRAVQPETPRLKEALGLDPRCAPTDGPVMTPTRWNDRFLFFANQPQQQDAVKMLYDEILSQPGGRNILREDAPWALRYSEAPPAPPPPPKPAFTNPLQMVWQCQNDNLTGTGWRECFSSSMAMIAMFHGKIANDDEYNKVRARFGDTTDSGAQIQALNSLGLQAFFFQNGRTADLEREINEGRPVGVGWLHQGPVSNPSGGGHWSVISGYTRDHWIHEDPNGVADMVNGGYTNNWDGHQVKYTRANWNRRWLIAGEGDGWYMQVKP